MHEAMKLKQSELAVNFTAGNTKLSELHEGKQTGDSWIVDEEGNELIHNEYEHTLGFGILLNGNDSAALRTAQGVLTTAQSELLQAAQAGNLNQTHIEQLDKAYSNLASVAAGFKVKDETKESVNEYISVVREQQGYAVKQAQEALRFQPPPQKPAMQSAVGESNSKVLMESMSGNCDEKEDGSNNNSNPSTRNV